MYDQNTHAYLGQNAGQYPNMNANYNQNYAGGGMNMNQGMNLKMMGVPMMGGMTTGGIFNGVFMYRGNPIGLQTRIDSMTPEEMSSIREATIMCTGTEIKTMNLCCFLFTVLCGGFLIFPLCFMCCDWWKKMVYPAHDIPIVAYQSLGRLISSPYLMNITINVVDSRFGAEKCQLLYSALSRSQVKGFQFTNGAGFYDYENDESSRFLERMRPIKSLPMQSEIKWGMELVL